MSAPEFTAAGVVIQAFQEIYDELAAGYRAIYGQDIDLSQDSPDGQRIQIEAKARHDLQQFALSVANGFDPDFATGTQITKIAKIAGINGVRPATRSQWDLKITTSRSVALPANYTIQDDLGQNWLIVAPVTAPAGESNVTFISELFGAISGLIGATFTQQTVVLGVVSFEAESNALVGTAEETEQEFRNRRRRSVAKPSFSVIGGLIAALWNIPGVTDVRVYENKTKVDDPVLDLNRNSVWAIVEGGTTADIVFNLVTQRSAGCDTKGSQSGSYTEVIPLPNGGSTTYVHVMQYDRPTPVGLYIRFNYTRIDIDEPVDVDLIKQNLAALDYSIGQNQKASDLYATARSAGNNYFVTDLEISLNGSTWTNEFLSPGAAGKFTVAVADITATEVAP